MSQYTHRLRHMIENKFPFNLNDYPIFDETYRSVLNKKILDYYYMSEIEHETAEIFNIRLGITMELIMPKYNNMYEMQKKLLDDISFETVETYVSDSKTISEADLINKATSSNEDTSSGENRFSDTPMNNITNLDNYLTQASRNSDTSSGSGKSDSETKSKNESDGNMNYTKKYLDPTKAIEVYKGVNENFRNIDMLVIEELDKLFFKLY